MDQHGCCCCLGALLSLGAIGAAVLWIAAFLAHLLLWGLAILLAIALVSPLIVTILHAIQMRK